MQSTFPRRRRDAVRRLVPPTPVLLLAGLLLAPGSTSQSPALLRDVHTGPPSNPSSWPTDFERLGPAVYFDAEAPTMGRIVWRTDGTAAGTTPFLDLEPTGTSFRTEFGDTLWLGNGRFLFVAADPNLGSEIWISDGSTAGTSLLLEIHPGIDHAAPGGFTALGNGQYVFAADGPANGLELWVTDGTAAGTGELFDIRPGPYGSVPDWFTTLANPSRVLFWADDDVHGREPWITDGTPQGTRMVADVAPGPGSTFDRVLGVLPGGQVVFRSSLNGQELWVTDGTAAGTGPIPGGPNSVRAMPGVVVGNELWFVGWDPVVGEQPWATDGTAAGTRRIHTFHWLPTAPGPRFVSALGGTRAVLWAYDQPWVTDGTSAGTLRLADLRTLGSSCLEWNGQLLFRAEDAAHGEELWRTDGTPGGTWLVADLQAGPASSSPWGFCALGNQVLFTAFDPIHGSEPWISDGTAAGTHLLADVGSWPAGWTASSNPHAAVDWFGRPVFLADSGGNDPAPWRSDGTMSGTSQLLQVPTGSTMNLLNEDGNPRLHVAGRELLMLVGLANDPPVLWRDLGNGPLPGPAITLNLGSLPLLDAAVAGNSAWFSGQHLHHVRDGVATTVDVAGQSHPWAWELTPLGEGIVCTAVSGIDDGLWRIEQATATLLHTFANSRPEALLRAGTRVYFVADDGRGAGNELWSTDGSVAGTQVLDLTPGSGSSWVTPLAEIHERLLFQVHARDGSHRLWLTDGTATGTMPFDVFPPGTTVDWIDELLPCGPDRFAFTMDDGVHGAEPWLLGVQGARLVADLQPGGASSRPQLLGATGEEFWFRSVYPSSGIYRSDGTVAGTALVVPGGGAAQMFVLSGGRIYFDRADGTRGVEPWVMSAGATAKPLPAGCGVGSRVAALEASDPVLGRIWQVRGRRGPAGSIAALLLGPPAVPPVIAGDCVVRVDPNGVVTLAWIADAANPWQRSWLLPNDAALVGLQLVLQSALAPSPRPAGFEVGEAVWLTLDTW